MDQVTSGLEADRKYTRKELRADKEFAREVFEFLLPDEKIRRQCLEFMANSIHTANRLAPDRWGITLQDDFVRLNCGMIEIITIAPDQFHLIIDVDSLPELPPDQAEIRKTYNGSTKGFYPSVRGSVACDFEAEKAFDVFPQIEDSHRRLIQKAVRSPFGPNRKNAHSPGVIQYLNEYLSLSLPQPSYPNATQEMTSHPDLKQQNIIVEFQDGINEDAHDLFQSWRSENWEDGYFINCKSRNRLILHRTACQHPGGFEWTREDSPDGHGLTKQKKICSADLQKLLRWADQQGLSKLEACKDCKPDLEIAVESLAALPLLPEELNKNEEYSEGAAKQILVNAYERDPKARAKCIVYYGTRCAVCGVNFEEKYGSVGKDFIHVHHLTPLSLVGESMLVDPIKDLRPVCANCHAIIHRKTPPYSIEEVAQMIEAASKK